MVMRGLLDAPFEKRIIPPVRAQMDGIHKRCRRTESLDIACIDSEFVRSLWDLRVHVDYVACNEVPQRSIIVAGRHYIACEDQVHTMQ